jgi:curli biogenesis system outer membrane secretion channel CsgG
MWTRLIRLSIAAALVSSLGAQTPAKPKPKAPVAKAAAASDPLIESVIDLTKSGLSEDLILKAIVKENRPLQLGVADLKLLKAAGVSDRVMGALMDPASVAAPAPKPEPPPVTSAPPPVVTSAPPPPPTPVASPAPAAPAKAVKRRLAVEEFEYATVQSAVQAVFNTQVDIGKGIRALLVRRLQNAGQVSVLERAAINKVMAEQDFGASNRVKKGSNARIGRILGADALLMGDIVAFGRDDRDQRVNVGAAASRIPGVGGMLGGRRIGKKEERAVVVLAYRIVDAETSEIIETGEAKGESKRTSKGLGGLLGAGGVVAGGAVDMTSSNFAETIIGEAVMEACDKLAELMNAKIPALPAKAMEVEGRVADVSGNTLTLNVGSNDGVNSGDVFEVFKVIKELLDPVTKEVLDLQTERIGELRISSVREKVSSGSYTGQAALVGALARKKMAGQ